MNTTFTTEIRLHVDGLCHLPGWFPARVPLQAWTRLLTFAPYSLSFVLIIRGESLRASMKKKFIVYTHTKGNRFFTSCNQRTYHGKKYSWLTYPLCSVNGFFNATTSTNELNRSYCCGCSGRGTVDSIGKCLCSQVDACLQSRSANVTSLHSSLHLFFP